MRWEMLTDTKPRPTRNRARNREPSSELLIQHLNDFPDFRE
jgi:hypothetical protein